MDVMWLLIGMSLGFGMAWVVRGLLLRTSFVAVAEFESLQRQLGAARADTDAIRCEQARLEERLCAAQRQLAESNGRERDSFAQCEKLTKEGDDLRTQLLMQQESGKSLQRELQEKEEYLVLTQKQLRDEFKNMATELLEDKSKKFTEINRNSMDQLLKPLSLDIEAFRTKVQETYEKETRERQSLKDEVQRLHQLNQQMSEDASNLTTALKGRSQTQGAWGEMVLELLLEKSGLRKDLHYRVQENFKSEENRDLRPDVVLYLPGDKHLVIDSKVSLTDYERHCSAQTQEERDEAAKGHLLSVRNHIRALSKKNYHLLHQLKSVDFVLMFVPIESAFALAVQADIGSQSGGHNIFTDALECNVVIVTSSTLLATLRTVDSIWRQENQSKHAIEIGRKSGAMLDKLAGFVDDLQGVGRRLEQASQSWDSAMGRLSTGKGNLIRRAEEIRLLGAKATKALPLELVESSDESASVSRVLSS